MAGHWVPEMVEAVGGVNLLNAKGEPSKVVTWRQIRDENPEVIVFMPCGYYLEEAEEEGAALFAPAGLRRHAGRPQRQRLRRGRHVVLLAAGTAASWTAWRSWPGRCIPEAYPEPPPASITRLK